LIAKKLTLECSHDDFHAVHAALDGARKSAQAVKVPRAALAALLRDHGQMIAAFKDQIGGIT